jgi:hypothetical protein
MSQSDPTPAPVPIVAPGYLSGFFDAMHKGAELVYHDVLAIEANVTQWTHTNPAIASLIEQGAQLGAAFLTAHGIPVASAELAASAVLATLRGMASNDTSVPSVAAPTPAVA